jgi:hypothetical protein
MHGKENIFSAESRDADPMNSWRLPEQNQAIEKCAGSVNKWLSTLANTDFSKKSLVESVKNCRVKPNRQVE